MPKEKRFVVILIKNKSFMIGSSAEELIDWLELATNRYLVVEAPRKLKRFTMRRQCTGQRRSSFLMQDNLDFHSIFGLKDDSVIKCDESRPFILVSSLWQPNGLIYNWHLLITYHLIIRWPFSSSIPKHILRYHSGKVIIVGGAMATSNDKEYSLRLPTLLNHMLH